jgi:hypothetical protein
MGIYFNGQINLPLSKRKVSLGETRLGLLIADADGACGQPTSE